VIAKDKQHLIKEENIKIIPRDLSWLSFNARVLQEAEDQTVPLVERFKFLGIFSSNLDEFFRVRVASLKRYEALNPTDRKTYGMTPKQILKLIQDKVIELNDKFEEIYLELERQLESEKIFIINEAELNEEQGNFVRNYFREKVRPTLVPVMLDTSPEFPMLKDKNIYLAIKLSKKDNPRDKKYALVEVPTYKNPRFIVIPNKEANANQYIILLDDVIRYCLDEIFYIFDYNQFSAYTIKLTRDAELDFDDDVHESIMQKLSKSLKERKKGRLVRFIYDESMPIDFLNFIIRKLHMLKSDNLIAGGRYHNFKDFMSFPDMGKSHLINTPLSPIYHKDIQLKKSLFSLLNKKDILLQYPYHSISHMIDFFREAAIDPMVVSVKTTFYRVAEDSNVINALINAIRNGKQVTVVVELQARFDEENNIYWANKLREEGAKVIFGVPDMKVHSKLCLITRKDKRVVTHYAYIGTGNFNEKTASFYSDHALLTSDIRITEEINQVFSFFESNLRIGQYKHLLVSPFFMRKEFIKLIDKEIKNARSKKEAYIFVKLNSLMDNEIIQKLYDASKAGVKIRMIIRGICSIKPGVKHLSDNIQAISIVDRFLEHSRIFIFCNGGVEKIYFGSADWMTRNLDHRVEVITPIYDRKIKDEIRAFMEMQWSDNVKARILDASQTNQYKTRTEDEPAIQAQTDYYYSLLDK